MRSVELFSGMGGLAKGLEQVGFQHVSFVEYNKHACASLRLNFSPDEIFEGDIKDFDLNSISNIDLVAGGPPCQPFSLGGKHKASADSRDMFPYAIEAIEKLKPKAFIFENVKGLLRQSFAEYFSYIILRLRYPDFVSAPDANWERNLEKLRLLNSKNYKGIKYDVSYQLVNAADYGVPQTRERVIIVGIRSDLNKKWIFPKPTHSVERLLWEQYVSGEYWKRHKIDLPDHIRDEDAQRMIKRLNSRYGIIHPSLKPWQTIRDAIGNIPHPQTSHLIDDHIFKDGAKCYPGHTGSDYDWPSKTIKAGGHGVPGGENMIRYQDGSIRYLTVYEAKILQTFPTDFVIAGAWGEAMRQIGNAVPVLLSEKIGQHLFDLIKEGRSIKKSA